MKKVKIISGVYGHHVNGRVKPVRSGEPPIELDDKEADRLVSIKVAEFVSEETDNARQVFNEDKEEYKEEDKEEDVIKTHLDRVQLETMKLDDLKKLASDMGIDVKNLKKAEIIDLVVQIEVEVDPKDVTDKPPAGFPDLNVEAPVE